MISQKTKNKFLFNSIETEPGAKAGLYFVIGGNENPKEVAASYLKNTKDEFAKVEAEAIKRGEHPKYSDYLNGKLSDVAGEIFASIPDGKTLSDLPVKKLQELKTQYDALIKAIPEAQYQDFNKSTVGTNSPEKAASDVARHAKQLNDDMAGTTVAITQIVENKKEFAEKINKTLAEASLVDGKAGISAEEEKSLINNAKAQGVLKGMSEKQIHELIKSFNDHEVKGDMGNYSITPASQSISGVKSGVKIEKQV